MGARRELVGAPPGAYNGLMPIELIRRRFTADEYHRMAEAGVLREHDRVELIEGEIVEMTPIDPRHGAVVDRLNHTLTRACGDRAIVRVQGSIRLGLRSEPQPDVVLLRPRSDFYETAVPGPESVLLLIEVAETSLPYDREIKLRLYARAGVPEVWLVDLVRNEVEIHREPTPEGYRRGETLGPGDRLAPMALPEVSLSPAQFLG
jgi:Uma2 family endonuclease